MRRESKKTERRGRKHREEKAERDAKKE